MRVDKKPKHPSDRGSMLMEFAGILPLILIVVLLCFEALVVATTVERVENAARTGAREASKSQIPAKCVLEAKRAMPTWINGPARVDFQTIGNNNGVACHVNAKVPVFFKNVHL